MSKSFRKAIYKDNNPGYQKICTRATRRVQKGFIKAHQLDLEDDDFCKPIPEIINDRDVDEIFIGKMRRK